MRRPWALNDPPAPDAAELTARAAASAPSFEGVTREEVLSHGTGLYEVVTTAGVPVRLHDMSFVSLTFTPSSPPLLEVRAVYDDPSWTPEVAADTPVAVFTFSNAVVLQHEDEPVEAGTPPEALRQISGFEYHEATATFALSTFTTYIVFTASTLRLTLEPAEQKAIPCTRLRSCSRRSAGSPSRVRVSMSR